MRDHVRVLLGGVMDNDQLRQSLTARRAEWTATLSQHQAVLESARAHMREAEAHIDEIDFALEALDAAPAKNPAPIKRRRRTRAIEQTAGTSDLTERTHARSLPEATPSDGAGDSTEMPAFLRRDKAAAE